MHINFSIFPKFSLKKFLYEFKTLTQELPNNENKNIDIQSSINMLKEGAKKFDPQEDLKEALKDCFGEPSIEN